MRHRSIKTSWHQAASCSTVRCMRTTLVIEDDVLEAARSLAEAEGKSVGEVISELARRGLAPQRQEAVEGGFPVFSVSPEPSRLRWRWSSGLLTSPDGCPPRRKPVGRACLAEPCPSPGSLGWFQRNQAAGWATCPLTESGFVRVSSDQILPFQGWQAWRKFAASTRSAAAR
jgi:hypothetical protein